MTRAIGRSLELYYIDGRPDGMLTAELFNWTGHVLMTPRTQIAEALARPEAGYAGIYLLLGELDGEPLAYVGEGEDISARIRSHDVRKEFWSSAVLITAAANKLNKAHVRYLEARLIAEARSIGRMPLDNATTPVLAALSEADVAKMEAFLENLFIVLPAVRVDMFIQRSRKHQVARIQHGSTLEPSTREDDAVQFVLGGGRHGLKATALLRDGEFVVEAGSLARPSWVGVNNGYAPLYAELERSGVFVVEGEHRVFTTDYAFRSPSAAAAVINGRSTNGVTSRREQQSGLTYKEWEARRLGASSELGS
jgi:hypothetical protein